MKTPHRRRTIGALVPAALALVAAATGRSEVLDVPEDFETITEAIVEAAWGDTILVAPGIYKESIVLTDQAGDGIVLRSVEGAAATTIAYGEVASVNEAVVTFQRCSNSTQLIGFTIDGRAEAKRGILANSESRPVLVDLVIHSADYGIASHRSSFPYIKNITIRKSSIAGLFIQGGSADVKDSFFTEGEKFGVYIRGTADPVRLRNCRVTGNGQVGVQATDGEFNMYGGIVTDNGDSGLILQDVSPLVSGVRIEGHNNIGIVMEASSATIQGCTVRNNGFGAVISIDGEPKIFRCVFEDNPSYHVGIEGDANPLIGGSIANANQFLGKASFSVQSSSSARVVATHNYWDKPCVPKDLFQVSSGRVIRKPWASPDLEQPFEDCTEARKYHKKWRKGKLPTSPTEEAAEAAEGAATKTDPAPTTARTAAASAG